MAAVGASGDAKPRSFTIGDFLEEGREELKLTLYAGSTHLGRTIEEPIPHRPGLALTGFWTHFPATRIHLIGNSERAYLESLSPAERRARLRAMLDHRAMLVVYTNGVKPPAEERRLFEAHGAILLSSGLATGVFAQQCAFVVERLTAPRASLYGTMVEVSGLGVLIEGAPGLGKSETALGLIKRGHALVSDDLTCVRYSAAAGAVFASASDSTAGYMEIRGIGIVHVPSLFGINAVRGEKRLQLVITFRRFEEVRGEIDRVGQSRHLRTILGCEVPNVIIPVSEGRDLVNLVETAAQQQKYLMAGFDPVESLSEHLRRRADAASLKKKKG